MVCCGVEGANALESVACTVVYFLTPLHTKECMSISVVIKLTVIFALVIQIILISGHYGDNCIFVWHFWMPCQK